MKKQSSENKLVITEEFIFDQNKLSKDPNDHFKSLFVRVAQGSALGPLLSLLYLLSLTKLFVNDTSLLYSGAHIADIAGIINHDLQLLSNWARQ